MNKVTTEELHSVIRSLKHNERSDSLDLDIIEVYEKALETMPHKISMRFLNGYFLPKNKINTYFDQIYILNLDRRPDRMEHMYTHMRHHKIHCYERFPALDGKEEPHHSEWKSYKRLPLTAHERIKYHRKGIGSPGSWAILKSMYLMLNQAIEREYEQILVFQDDLLFHKKFNHEFNRVAEKLSGVKWKLLYLGATQHSWSHVSWRNGNGLGGRNKKQEQNMGSSSIQLYHPNGTADGAFAVAIHQSVFKELIDLICEFTLPVDSGPLKTIQRRYPKECFVVQPNLVIADIRDSDLRGFRNLETFSKRFRWDLDLYHIVTI